MRRGVRLLSAALVMAMLAFGSLATAPIQAQSNPPLQVLRIGTTMSDDFTPVLYALKNDMFKKAGLDVQVTVLGSGAAIATAVVGGALDLGKSSIVSLMAAHVKGVPLAIVCPGAIYDARTPYAALVMPADASYKTGKDLEGKTVASPALNDFNSLVTKMWVDQNGGDSSLVQFVEMPNVAQAAALAAHRIDGAVLQQPDLQNALDSGKVKQLGLAYSAISQQFMFAGWFASTDWATKHPDLVRTFRRVAIEAAKYTNAHHAETAGILADATKMPLTVVSQMPRVDSATALDEKLIQPMVDAAAKYKMLPHTFPAKEMIFDPGPGR
jgi:NitT/TauT family transport system substrate-binding protein